MAPRAPPYPRPVPDLDLSELPLLPGAEIYIDDDQSSVYSGTSEGVLDVNDEGFQRRKRERERVKHQESGRAAKYRRIEAAAHSYLRGENVLIISAGLKGPFGEGWKNPWAEKKSSKVKNAAKHSTTGRRNTLAGGRLERVVPANRGKGVEDEQLDEETDAQILEKSRREPQGPSPSMAPSTARTSHPPVVKTSFDARLQRPNLSEKKVEDWLKRSDAFAEEEMSVGTDSMERSLRSSPTPVRPQRSAGASTKLKANMTRECVVGQAGLDKKVSSHRLHAKLRAAVSGKFDTRVLNEHRAETAIQKSKQQSSVPHSHMDDPVALASDVVCVTERGHEKEDQLSEKFEVLHEIGGKVEGNHEHQDEDGFEYNEDQMVNLGSEERDGVIASKVEVPTSLVEDLHVDQGSVEVLPVRESPSEGQRDQMDIDHINNDEPEDSIQVNEAELTTAVSGEQKTKFIPPAAGRSDNKDPAPSIPDPTPHETLPSAQKVGQLYPASGLIHEAIASLSELPPPSNRRSDTQESPSASAPLPAYNNKVSDVHFPLSGNKRMAFVPPSQPSKNRTRYAERSPQRLNLSNSNPNSRFESSHYPQSEPRRQKTAFSFLSSEPKSSTTSIKHILKTKKSTTTTSANTDINHPHSNTKKFVFESKDSINDDDDNGNDGDGDQTTPKASTYDTAAAAIIAQSWSFNQKGSASEGALLHQSKSNDNNINNINEVRRENEYDNDYEHRQSHQNPYNIPDQHCSGPCTNHHHHHLNTDDSDGNQDGKGDLGSLSAIESYHGSLENKKKNENKYEYGLGDGIGIGISIGTSGEADVDSGGRHDEHERNKTAEEGEDLTHKEILSGFNLDEAINDVGSFLGSWDSEKEAVRLMMT